MTIYVENSGEKILNGHAYSRAVRAHRLANLSLVSCIMNEKIQLTEEERLEIQYLLEESKRSQLLHASYYEAVPILSAKFNTAMEVLEEKSPTSKLWVQYYKMTTLMKKFIEAERMGNWDLHLDTVKNMLPFFHSAGHFLYAKSARLYLQDMSKLEQTMDPTEFIMFTQQGDFTIRRSHKFWAGLWTDLTIEQVLMKSMEAGRLDSQQRYVQQCSTTLD